jgi:hypothetical protein
MFYYDYPKVKHSLGLAALHDPYPAWHMDTRGVIRGANLMAFWLWDALQPGEPIRPDALLGKSVFQILAHNFARIPVDQNVEFYTKKSAVVKRMNAGVGTESILYASFIAAMKADPRLKNIFEQAPLYPDKEWENSLKITLPNPKGSSDMESGFLEFQVTIFSLERNTGFLAMYMPASTSVQAFEELYSQLADQYSNKIYVQPDDLKENSVESGQLPTNFGSHYRAYYPSIIHDPLWYITGENKAFRLLVGNPVIGMHFFELFFAPQLREWLGPIQETSAPRAIRYFEVFTAGFLREEHELHAEYVQTMKHLMQLQDFQNMLEISRKLSIHLNMPDNPETPFYTCRVILPWPFSPEIALEFRSMVRFIHRNLLVHTDIRDYQVTLVPENYETEAALILLQLVSTAQSFFKDNTGLTPSFMQFLWLLTVIKTVKEGLTWGEGEEDTQWELESAFGRIRDELAVEYSKFAADETDKLIAEIREIIETVDDKKIVNKGVLLDMLYSLTGTMSYMDQLGVFLAGEIEKHKSDEGRE